MSFDSALATSTRTVRVTLTADARAVSAIGTGDALNPATWRVVSLDHAANVDVTFTVLAVRQVSPSVYELLLLEKLGSYLVTHVVSSTTLLDETGSLVSVPRSADFLGIEEASARQDLVAPADLRNNPVPRSPAGTLVVDSAGDYETHSGVALLKKLILRRLTTAPGDFFHLPDYGLGLRAKDPMNPAELPRLKAEVERQVMLEPEVDAVRAQVSLDRDGVLTIQLRVRTKTGDEFEDRIPIPSASE
jgi:phage baseplate assembly protein W